eukprot:CCRYP_007716-RE/>CCRYP_007716-RE protein AED:0.46 eAED:0.46 QI:0/0/0/1/0/0/3/0/205
MVLRGVCLFRRKEIDWLFGDPPLKQLGVSTKSQEQMTTQRNRSVLIQYYHRLLGSNSLIRARAAQSWFRWEMGIYSSGLPKETQSKTNGNKTELLHIPPLSTMKSSQPMPSSTDQSYPLPPCIAIQGGLDAICPPDTALDLHHSWKELELRIALSSGHSMYDPVIAGEIVKALDRFGQALLKEQNEEVRLVGENVPSVAMAVCLQ